MCPNDINMTWYTVDTQYAPLKLTPFFFRHVCSGSPLQIGRLICEMVFNCAMCRIGLMFLSMFLHVLGLYGVEGLVVEGCMHILNIF